MLLPTIDLAGRAVTRLIVGGNPFSGNSHTSPELDWEMARYFSQERILHTLAECERCGINALQARGDAHIMRTYLEHRERGGGLQWIAQTASEMADLRRNAALIARFGAMAIYHHGSATDHLWQAGRKGEIADRLKLIHDTGLPTGLGTHLPEVVAYSQEQGWEVDFYLCCFYGLSRQEKAFPTLGQDTGSERFAASDPEAMTRVMRAVPQPCLGFKILAAGRRCGSSREVAEAFRYAFAHTKPTDALVVGMFPKHSAQVAENAAIVRELLGAG